MKTEELEYLPSFAEKKFVHYTSDEDRILLSKNRPFKEWPKITFIDSMTNVQPKNQKKQKKNNKSSNDMHK
jgi:hypothetical protein